MSERLTSYCLAPVKLHRVGGWAEPWRWGRRRGFRFVACWFQTSLWWLSPPRDAHGVTQQDCLPRVLSLHLIWPFRMQHRSQTEIRLCDRLSVIDFVMVALSVCQFLLVVNVTFLNSLPMNYESIILIIIFVPIIYWFCLILCGAGSAECKRRLLPFKCRRGLSKTLCIV